MSVTSAETVRGNQGQTGNGIVAASAQGVPVPTQGNAVQNERKPAGGSPKPSNKALATACFRFFLAISISLLLSLAFHDIKIGGFAALASFMALLSDTKTDLRGRLGGLAILFVGLMIAVGIGYLSHNLSYGKWVVIGIVCFGASLLSLAESFWWLFGKYFLIFLMVSLFDFVPDKSAVFGYTIGFVISAVVITLDSYLWKIDQLGTRPMDEIKKFIGGVRNPQLYAGIAALVLIFSLWTAEAFGFDEPAWVGITVIYLLNTKVSVGIKKSIQRIVGTVVSYVFVVLVYPYMNDLFLLAVFIVLMGMMIPWSMVKNYSLASFFITSFVLFDLDWLLRAYGGDEKLLGWRLLDTLYGVACTLVGFALIELIAYCNRYKKSF